MKMFKNLFHLKGGFISLFELCNIPSNVFVFGGINELPLPSKQSFIPNL